MNVDELVQPERGRVHARIYTDPEIFNEEIRRIFFKTWVYVGHESELPEAGSYKTTYIGSVPLILTRDDAGEIHVLVNRCVHRGATVCQSERGTATHFRCEYHAWTYNPKGDLIGVSRPDGYSAQELAAFPTGLAKAPRVDTCAGLIFASFSAEGRSLSDHLGNAKPYLENWAALSPTGKLDVSGGVWRHTYRGNWKLQLEGSNEGYHPDFLHRIVGLMNQRYGTVRRVGSFATSEAAGLDLGNGHSLMEHPPAAGEFKGADAAYVAQLAQRVGPEKADHLVRQTWRMQLFPNLAISTEQVRVIRPVSVDETEVLQFHVRLPDASETINDNRVRKHREFGGPSGYGSPDDLEMFERIQEGCRSMQWEGALPWVWFSRGLDAEVDVGNGVRRGHTSSEIEQRAIYYEYVRLMRGEAGGVPPVPVGARARG
jgi:phenylpropionate dioxygenase-like ring-hydroxylating dioxygenase large terminal subunit